MTRKTGYQDAAKEALMKLIAGEVVFSARPGAAMRKWRDLFEISQTELAHKLEFAPSVLSDYEKNRRKSPGAQFVRRFVTALVTLDEAKGGLHTERYASTSRDVSRAILDIAEFTAARTVSEVAKAVRGKLIACPETMKLPVYGYTVVNSLEAIKVMSSQDFVYLFGSNSIRALVFSDVTKGRSPMIAVKIYPIKPRMVILHGPRRTEDVDTLALELAETEHIPLVLSLERRISHVAKALRRMSVE